MRRRELIGLGAAAVIGMFTGARAAAERPRLGILLVGNSEPFWTVFLGGLSELGHIDGQTVALHVRSAEGNPGRLAELAADLVRIGVDIIIASETPAVQAARRATSDIPIVMAPSGDPVGTGLISSLARPGGNITGLSAATAELAGKSLELVRELLPSAQRVAALADPTNPFTKPFLEHVLAAARILGLEVSIVMAGGPADYEAAFEAMAKAGIAALVVQPTLPRTKVIALTLRYRLPAVSGNRAFADGGGLMSYSASLADRYRNAAMYVDKILKGAKPADLPVQQPTRFELVLNNKSAKALGLTFPPTLLVRADEVIE